jgi:hypothetical protein
MNEEKAGALEACADRLSAATEALEQVLGKLEAQYESLNQKVERIIAAVEEDGISAGVDALAAQKTAELEKRNAELEAEVRRGARKTLSPVVSSLLAKGGVEAGQSLEAGVLEQALRVLSVEQRVAVKAELARAGLIG